MDSSVENVENYTKRYQKCVKFHIFPTSIKYMVHHASLTISASFLTISAMVYCKKLSLLSKQASLVIEIGFI